MWLSRIAGQLRERLLPSSASNAYDKLKYHYEMAFSHYHHSDFLSGDAHLRAFAEWQSKLDDCIAQERLGLVDLPTAHRWKAIGTQALDEINGAREIATQIHEIESKIFLEFSAKRQRELAKKRDGLRDEFNKLDRNLVHEDEEEERVW